MPKIVATILGKIVRLHRPECPNLPRPTLVCVEVLAEYEWRAREAKHYEHVRRWTEPHRRRTQRGEKHPVLDFLFTYYRYKPARLERWQPGHGVVLAAGDRFLQRSGYTRTDEGVTLDPALLTPSRRSRIEYVHSLLSATASREPKLGCFGLHEWAMVYRSEPSDVRHAGWPLRLGHSGTDDVIESVRIQCTHHDAFRFFTEPATKRNAWQLRREDQRDFEQPGCLHANMDLFKWAYKLDPFVPSELLAACFDLAARVRELDMRASPYDFSELGYAPVAIETPEGRADYVRKQDAFGAQAAVLRQQLIVLCDELLADRSERTVRPDR